MRRIPSWILLSMIAWLFAMIILHELRIVDDIEYAQIGRVSCFALLILVIGDGLRRNG